MLYDKRWDSKIKQGDAILLGAADYIRDFGWCQRDFKKGNGQVCALGAISQAACVNQSYQEAYHKLKKYLGVSCVSTWNDKPERTQEQVVEALMGAAYFVEG